MPAPTSWIRQVGGDWRVDAAVERSRDIGAFGRRAIIEQAKGILMERNGIDAEAAFGLLNSRSPQTGQKLSEVARALTQTHLLLAETEPGKGQSE